MQARPKNPSFCMRHVQEASVAKLSPCDVEALKALPGGEPGRPLQGVRPLWERRCSPSPSVRVS